LKNWNKKLKNWKIYKIIISILPPFIVGLFLKRIIIPITIIIININVYVTVIRIVSNKEFLSNFLYDSQNFPIELVILQSHKSLLMQSPLLWQSNSHLGR